MAISTLKDSGPREFHYSQCISKPDIDLNLSPIPKESYQ